MYSGPNDKILRDEALKRVQKSDILHSSGLIGDERVGVGGVGMTYEQRKERNRQYVGKYDFSQLGTTRNPLQAATKSTASRFDAQIKRRPRR